MSGEESRRLGRWGEDLSAAFLEEKIRSTMVAIYGWSVS